MKEQDGFLTDRMWKKSSRQCFGMPDSRSSIKVILQESGRCENMWHGIQKDCMGQPVCGIRSIRLRAMQNWKIS